MLRKPNSQAPLPAFPTEDDDGASTGEYRAVVHGPAPSGLPRFPSLPDVPAGASGLPRFPSLPDDGRAKLPRFASLPDDVAKTLEKQPVTAQSAHRILSQLDRSKVRPDATGEVDISDVLEEVYAEPPPRSTRAPASSEPPPRPVPPPPPSFTGTDFPAPAPRASAQAPSSPPPVALAAPAPPPSPVGPSPEAMPVYAVAPYAAHPAYAATVPAGYVLVPQSAVMGHAFPAAPPPPHAQAPHALVPIDPSAPLSSDAALVQPLAVAPPPSPSLLPKVLAGAVILGVSALAGGAASYYLAPDRPAETTPAAQAQVAVPSAPVSVAAPVSAAPVQAPSASVAPSVSVMVPLGTGWPLAPATVPPGAASAAPLGSASVVVPVPAAPPSASSDPTLAAGMGRLAFAPARQWHRVWVDGVVLGESSPTPLVVKCGKRNVRVGSQGMGQTVDVPCGGEALVR
ncbi:MAG: hypothetical protein U0183_30225 [Polyangiaceae bacterium]